jgi:hypothetical protein
MASAITLLAFFSSDGDMLHFDSRPYSEGPLHH